MSASWFLWGGLVAALAAGGAAAWGSFTGARGPVVRALVILGNVLAVLLVGWLAVSASDPAENGRAWLVTAGADSNVSQRPVYQAVDLDPAWELPGVPVLAAPSRLWRDGAGATQVRVSGWGLTAEHWRELRMPAAGGFDVMPGPPGVSELDWPRRVREGSPVRIAGRVAGMDRGRIRVTLGELELGVAATNPEGEFSVDLIAPVPGRYELSLQVVDELDEPIDGGTVPLQVTASPRLRILALASSPSFDWRYLKNWLSDNDAALLLRTRISSEHFQEQRQNVASGISADPIGEAALDVFDIVIADAGAWSRLAGAERELIERRVRDDGLGLLLLADDATQVPSDVLPAASPTLISATELADARLRAGASAPLPELPVPAQAISGAVSVWDREDGRSVAGFNEMGEGRVGVAVRVPVYQWVTSGATEAFAGYWQRLLAAIARPHAAGPVPRLSSPIPFADLRLELCFDAAVNPEVELEGPALIRQPLPLYRRPTGSCGVLWPRAGGWHVVHDGDTAHFFYVFSQSDWIPLQVAGRTAATYEVLGQSDNVHGIVRWEPSPWHLFVALLVTLGLLWWEQKRRPVRVVKPVSDSA